MFQVKLTDTEIACTCADWVRHCLPCKHIFSVVKQKFMSLPENYRSCIEFNSSVQLDKSRTHYSVTSFSSDPATPSPDDRPGSCLELDPELESPPSASIVEIAASEGDSIDPGQQEDDLLELPTTAKVHNY